MQESYGTNFFLMTYVSGDQGHIQTSLGFLCIKQLKLHRVSAENPRDLGYFESGRAG